MKKVLTSCLVVLICLTAFITGYCKGCYSYADTVTYMTDEELEAGINAYIEAKGGSMLGTVGARMAYAEGKLYNFLTSSDNATPIKTIEDLKSGLSWNRQAIEGMDSKDALMLSVTPTANSFLASYLVWLRQQHYFGDYVTENENGMFDDGIDNNLYSGYTFTDDNGNSCLVMVTTQSNLSPSTNNSSILSYGTPFIYDGATLSNIYKNSGLYPNSTYNLSFVKNQNTYNIKINANYYNYSYYGIKNADYNNESGGGCYGKYTWNGTTYFNYIGYPCIWFNNTNQRFYYGTYSYESVNGKYQYQYNGYITEQNANAQNVNIKFYTNNNNNISVFPTINEGDNLYITPKVNVGLNGEVDYQPYIINEGDTITNVVNNYYTDSGTKDKTITVPSDTPDTGGGGSSDNPSGGTPPNWTNPFPHLSPDGEGGFNFNFTLPDLNIDWNINGLTEKFPFSIPFDLIHFVQVLNAEPETPEFDWTIDLKIYQWHIDADLHQFDNLASIVRNVEFIGFCITLVMITRRMIKG